MFEESILRSTAFNDYVAYKYDISSELINKYLPDKLPPFVSMTPKNIAKRTIVYLTPLILTSQSQIIDNWEQLPYSTTIEDLLEQLLSKHDSKFRYNFVLTGSSFSIVQTPQSHNLLHCLFCKHATLCNNSKDVRFAGEFWRDENNAFWLNNNSGTYQPADVLLDSVIRLFRQLTPHLKFQATSFRDAKRPSIKDRLISK